MSKGIRKTAGERKVTKGWANIQRRGEGVQYVLSVHRSRQHITALLMTPDRKVLWEVSTKTPEIRKQCKNTSNKDAAFMVGKAFADYVKKKKLKGRIVFMRASYRYTGRVAAVAEGAREGGALVS